MRCSTRGSRVASTSFPAWWLYDWKGAREEAAEAVLIAKTTAAIAPRARELIEREHPYDVPAILTLPLDEVNPAYRDWLLSGIGLPRFRDTTNRTGGRSE
jgi:periplasmic divalent cation tolerance protein